MKSIHVWGSPVYVLKSQLQDGVKTPHWSPQHTQCQFLGFSMQHSLQVVLVRNLNTGSVTPQWHVGFDDSFSTSFSTIDTSPPHWNDLV
eukprot:1260366-Ditylum_brightwellii.AAC.1